MAITFRRELSPFILNFFAEKAAQNSRNYNSQFAIELTLKSGTKLWYATANVTLESLSIEGVSVAITPLVFSSRIEGAPEIRHTQTKAPDYGQVEIVNLDYLISSAIPNAARPFENCKVRAFLCFPKTSGAYEGLIMFDGLLSGLQGDDETADLSLIADGSSKAAMLGREITQRCLNELGDDWCGVPVSTLPPGAVCSKVWNDLESGCKYWGGVMQAVPFLNPAAFAPAGGAGGFDPDTTGGGVGNHCPDFATSWFQSANGGYIHARDMRVGEVIEAPNGCIVTVEQADRVYAPYRYHVRTRYGSALIVSAKHKFLSGAGDTDGRSAVSWKFHEYDLLCKTPEGVQWAEHKERMECGAYNYSFGVAAAGDVLALAVSSPNTYWAGMEPGFMLGCHNKEPVYTDIPQY